MMMTMMVQDENDDVADCLCFPSNDDEAGYENNTILLHGPDLFMTTKVLPRRSSGTVSSPSRNVLTMWVVLFLVSLFSYWWGYLVGQLNNNTLQLVLVTDDGS